MAAATQAADAEERERMAYARDSIQWHLGMAATTALRMRLRWWRRTSAPSGCS